MTHTKLKEKSIKLRKEGYSYNYIQKETGVAKSTLSNWLSDIEYTPNKYIIDRMGKARALSGLHKHRQKLSSIKKAGVEAKKEFGRLNKRDLFMLGLGIYIGEGTKYGETIRIINANPEIIRLSVRWFKECLGLKNENLIMRIHIYPDNDLKECLNFWSKKTNIPLNQFRKTQIDKREGKKISKRGKLPYGTAHLTIKSNGDKRYGVFLARKIKAWINLCL